MTAPLVLELGLVTPMVGQAITSVRFTSIAYDFGAGVIHASWQELYADGSHAAHKSIDLSGADVLAFFSTPLAAGTDLRTALTQALMATIVAVYGNVTVVSS